MKEKIAARLKELQEEQVKVLATMQAISGAIQVLSQLLQEAEAEEVKPAA